MNFPIAFCLLKNFAKLAIIFKIIKYISKFFASVADEEGAVEGIMVGGWDSAAFDNEGSQCALIEYVVDMEIETVVVVCDHGS